MAVDAEQADRSFVARPPALALPTGGGAIRSLGEKFTANAVTGTATVSVPVPTSPGRDGFGPQLRLSYDSGAGNGAYGLGWDLGLPAITRRTDHGLPRYRDDEESDVFILSGAEDLVPVLADDGGRRPDTTTAPGFRIDRYRPRIEGLFARIERWTRISDPADVHWRSLSRDNVLTVFGRDAGARIADPADATRVFSWRISETRDAKGNAVLYDYEPEDAAGVDLTAAHERHRGDRLDPRRRANRYLKRIRYGNAVPLLTAQGRRPPLLSRAELDAAGWHFEVVFDYGEHDESAPTPTGRAPAGWPCRADPFSTYRSGFEVRTYRLCRRILMFHHFDAEPGVGRDCLVRSMTLEYRPTPVVSYLVGITQRGHRRDDAGYRSGALPTLRFTYQEPVADPTVHDATTDTLAGLPAGVDGTTYRLVDLDADGLSGVLTEQGGAWLYRSNQGDGRLGPLRTLARRPTPTGSGAQLIDLDGGGRVSLVEFGGSTPGSYGRTEDGDWAPFRPFRSVPTVDWNAPGTHLLDLDGDGRADLLVTEDEVFTWYPSLGADGFGTPRRVPRPPDDERGPYLVRTDPTEQLYVGDASGDGLSDLMRVRNGEVCYWPNLGYGRFGAKVVMDASPVFHPPDQFRADRLRVADVDGSGTLDLIYLGRDGVRLYRNLAGNGWSGPQPLPGFPALDDNAAVIAADFLGTGTACLLWSSSLPGDAGRQLRYVDLTGGRKPHLLTAMANNLGAETRVHYTPSTTFAARDRAAGRPWITQLPFPVHVVERVECRDRISRSVFLTRYAYHHGYFDPHERELRGFALVEQWDTERYAVLAGDGRTPDANVDAALHVPPVLTRTWYHTGAVAGGGLPGDGAVLPPLSSPADEREAYRALKGSMLRQEIYGLDGSARAEHPYTVVDQSFEVRVVQPRGPNRHAVFRTHPRESVTSHYERNPDDPRVTHTMSLEVDAFGNVLKQADVAYGRRVADPALPLPADRAVQGTTVVTYTERRVTDAVTGESHHLPLPCEERCYELTGYPTANRLTAADLVRPDPADPTRLVHVFDSELDYTERPTQGRQRRLVEHVRTRYRRDDLTGLLDLGRLEGLALPGERYRLAFTPTLLRRVFQRPRVGLPPQDLLPDPAAVLGGEGGYVDLDGDGRWWVRSGQVFHSPTGTDTPAQERAHARRHFFRVNRFRDPFGHTSTVTFDRYDLLVADVRDPVGNRVTAGQRRPDGSVDPSRPGHDYRVLLPVLLSDANRNRTEAAYDMFGWLTGAAVRGKPEEDRGDTLDGFVPDLTAAELAADLADPLADPWAILAGAGSRTVYDVLAYQRTADQADPQPAMAHTLAREAHRGDPGGQRPALRHTLSYHDGYGRQVQCRTRGPAGRWVVSGWTVHNNKNKPVRQYEPFFSDTHRFEFDVRAGVSSVVFYDPAERVVATLHPNDTYQKVVFDAWRQVSFDVNDTVGPDAEVTATAPETGDPRTDPDIGGYVAAYAATLPAGWRTWRERRVGGGLGEAERVAAEKATVHANTPTTTHLDPLGRTFLTVERNRFERDGARVREASTTRVEIDIEGNTRVVRDAVTQAGDASGRVVLRSAYDLLGTVVQQVSMDAGARWTLNDVAGQLVRAWDSRGHTLRREFDPARRPTRVHVTGADPARPDDEVLTDRIVYGEQHPTAERDNLRGRECLRLDQAGALATVAVDFKGNPLVSSRRVTLAYRAVADWATVDAALPTDAATPFDPARLAGALAPRLDADIFATAATYDALNRVLTTTLPDATVLRSSYNQGGLLDRVEANLRGAATPTRFVTGIDYDAHGRRTSIRYGSGTGVTTTYTYDRLTARLTRLRTTRDPKDFPDDCPQPPRPGWPGCGIQDLTYTYDPAGNVVRVGDAAQQAVFFRGVRVEPDCAFTYDARYRLLAATGREHVGQAGGAPQPHSPDDAGRTGLAHPNDGRALARYIERYVYDAVGNLVELAHRRVDAANTGWTQAMRYAEASATEANRTGNRLTATVLTGVVRPHRHDAHGNLTRLPHLGGADPAPNLYWDYRDQLARADLGGGGTAHFCYDSAGMRVRTVWEKADGLVEERIYHGAYEVFRRRTGAGALTRQRETVHVPDGTRRIALVETRTPDIGPPDPAPERLIRYQFGNHLGSACVELDGDARIVSYEEYSPYGATTYQGVAADVETPKRYRFTGLEHDEATGLYYHGARYYAPWLARWTRCDPAGIADGVNPYQYARQNPVALIDPQGTKARPGAQASADDQTDLLTRVGAGTMSLDDLATASRAGSPPSTGPPRSVYPAGSDPWAGDAPLMTALVAPLPLDAARERAGATKPPEGVPGFEEVLVNLLATGALEVTVFPLLELAGPDGQHNVDEMRQALRPLPYQSPAQVRSAGLIESSVAQTLTGLFSMAASASGAARATATAAARATATAAEEAAVVAEDVAAPLAKTGQLTPAERAALPNTALEAEKLGGNRVWLVGPEGGGTARAVRQVGLSVTYDTAAPSSLKMVRQDMGAIRNAFGLQGRGNWWTGTHGTPLGEFGGEEAVPRWYSRESRFASYYGLHAIDAGAMDPADVMSRAVTQPTVFNWCFSSASFLK